MFTVAIFIVFDFFGKTIQFKNSLSLIFSIFIDITLKCLNKLGSKKKHGALLKQKTRAVKKVKAKKLSQLFGPTSTYEKQPVGWVSITTQTGCQP